VERVLLSAERPSTGIVSFNPNNGMSPAVWRSRDPQHLGEK